MLDYIVALLLGIVGIYKVRDGLLILQNKHDEKEK